jgi:hypothetical protein
VLGSYGKGVFSTVVRCLDMKNAVPGTEVAIKVQRPGTAAAMRLDFFIVRAGAALLDGAIPGLNTSLAAAVDAFAAKVFGELDYVAEGRSAERFAALYGDAPDVLVPAVHWGACSSRVMTMEWVDGIKLSDTAALTARGLDVVRLVNIGIRCSLRQLLEAGFFHADPHPGNLLGTADGRLAFIDFGMMAETPASARYAIIVHVCHLGASFLRRSLCFGSQRRVRLLTRAARSEPRLRRHGARLLRARLPGAHRRRAANRARARRLFRRRAGGQRVRAQLQNHRGRPGRNLVRLPLQRAGVLRPHHAQPDGA